MNAEAHRNLMSTSPCKPSGSHIKFVIVYLKCNVVGDVDREFWQVFQHIFKRLYYVNGVYWKMIVWRSSLKLTEHTWPRVCPDRLPISGADCRQAEGEKKKNVLMENIRPRLKFGNKVEEVKLRKRKSQLYIKTDESHLDNGWALIFICGAKTGLMLIKLCCNDKTGVMILVWFFYFLTPQVYWEPELLCFLLYSDWSTASWFRPASSQTSTGSLWRFPIAWSSNILINTHIFHLCDWTSLCYYCLQKSV